MYLTIIALENMNIINKKKGKFLFLFKVVGLMCFCLWVLECVNLNLMTIIEEIMDSDLRKLYTINYFNMLQIYCNISQTYMLLCRLSVT